VAEAASQMRYRGVASYLFGVEPEHVRPFSWVYLPHASQGPANRITYLSNYSPNNAPAGKGSILAEVTFVPGEEPAIDAEGRADLARALQDAGLLDADRIAVSDGYLNPCAYILYDLRFEERRDTVLAHLDALPGFHALGRFGRYEYHNSDQVLAQTFDLIERLRPVLAAGGGPP
jgi:protoporphyrinogen oxidase